MNPKFRRLDLFKPSENDGEIKARIFPYTIVNGVFLGLRMLTEFISVSARVSG
jgi:hypothetical protein